MKKLITLDAVACALVSAVVYGFGYQIPNAYGCNMWVSLAICMGIGILFEEIIEKIIYSPYIQENIYRKMMVFAGVLVLFVNAYYFGIYEMNYSLFDEKVPVELFFGVGMPILGFLFALIKRYISLYRIRRKYSEGNFGYVIGSKEREYIQSLNGTNQEIQGDYDEECAV